MPWYHINEGSTAGQCLLLPLSAEPALGRVIDGPQTLFVKDLAHALENSLGCQGSRDMEDGWVRFTRYMNE